MDALETCCSVCKKRLGTGASTPCSTGFSVHRVASSPACSPRSRLSTLKDHGRRFTLSPDINLPYPPSPSFSDSRPRRRPSRSDRSERAPRLPPVHSASVSLSPHPSKSSSGPETRAHPWLGFWRAEREALAALSGDRSAGDEQWWGLVRVQWWGMFDYSERDSIVC